MKYVFEVTVHVSYRGGATSTLLHRIMVVATDDIVARQLAIKNLHKLEGKDVIVRLCEISLIGEVEEEE